MKLIPQVAIKTITKQKETKQGCTIPNSSKKIWLRILLQQCGRTHEPIGKMCTQIKNNSLVKHHKNALYAKSPAIFSFTKMAKYMNFQEKQLSTIQHCAQLHFVKTYFWVFQIIWLGWVQNLYFSMQGNAIFPCNGCIQLDTLVNRTKFVRVRVSFYF